MTTLLFFRHPGCMLLPNTHATMHTTLIQTNETSDITIRLADVTQAEQMLNILTTTYSDR